MMVYSFFGMVDGGRYLARAGLIDRVFLSSQKQTFGWAVHAIVEECTNIKKEKQLY
jgi:hypothetical protein